MRKRSLECIYKLAQSDERIVFIGSDLGAGVLENMKKKFPKRFFMEGIAEQHIVGMASGMAKEGYIPFINTIGTFLTRRCFEQITLDLCLHDLPVRLIANGGGLVYAPLGPTHLAVEDVAILRALPNMTIIAPCDADEISRVIENTSNWLHPIYIRLAKGGDKIISKNSLKFKIGKAILLIEPRNALIISTGIMTQRAIEIAENLKNNKIDCGILHIHTIKPLDKESLLYWIPKVDGVFCIEEHSRIGGLGSAVLELVSDYIPNDTYKINRYGLPDNFLNDYGSQETLLEKNDLDIKTLSKKITDKMDELNVLNKRR